MGIAEGVYDSQRVLGGLTGTHYTVMILETVAGTPLGDWALVQLELVQWFRVESALHFSVCNPNVPLEWL